MKNALCLTAKISLHSVHFTLKGKILYVVFVVKSKMLLSFFFTILKTHFFFFLQDCRTFWLSGLHWLQFINNIHKYLHLWSYYIKNRRQRTRIHRIHSNIGKHYHFQTLRPASFRWIFQLLHQQLHITAFKASQRPVDGFWGKHQTLAPSTRHSI